MRVEVEKGGLRVAPETSNLEDDWYVVIPYEKV